MKFKKAQSWEQISEGTLTAKEIDNITNRKQPITLLLTGVSTKDVATVQIIAVRGPGYVVFNQSSRVHAKPYKYLSCAVRRAVKEYKSLIRQGQWRVVTK